MRKFFVCAVAVLLSFSVSSFAAEHEHEDSAKRENAEAKTEANKADKTEAAAHEHERAVTTSHSVTINGHNIGYRATAGTLIIRDDKGKPDASVFYVAYTVGEGRESAHRPVTFLYNGGPGSASIWLHMGSFGPVRVATSSPEATAPAPYQLVPNADSLLDKSDLVFVDAIGTELIQRPGNERGRQGRCQQGRIREGRQSEQTLLTRYRSGHRCVRPLRARYITVNQRWNSPKFLFGESYGTPRSAGLAKYLEDHGIALNGVVLLSSILNYGSRLPGIDNDFVNLLPSYAAIAWYHNKIVNKPASLEPFLDEVRAFARSEYTVALAKGQDLEPAELDVVAQKVSRYTGRNGGLSQGSKLAREPAALPQGTVAR